MRSLHVVLMLPLIAVHPGTAIAQTAPAAYQREARQTSATPSPLLTPQNADALESANDLQARPIREDRRPTGVSSSVTVFASLAFVLGLFLLAVWLFRRMSPVAARLLPAEVFEILGRAALGGHQQVRLIRCGGKLLLVAMNPAGATTLAEITDPAEVDHLLRLCAPSSGERAAQNTRQPTQQENRDV